MLENRGPHGAAGGDYGIDFRVPEHLELFLEHGVIYTESLKTLPNVLSQVSNGTMARAGVEAVAALIILLPPILFFIIFQRRIIETMSSSGIKG